MPTEKEIIQTVKNWIANFIIQYNLCPFAKKPFVQNKISYIVYESEDLEELATILQQTFTDLQTISRSSLETTIIILPNLLQNFNDYLAFLEVANRLIFALRLEGIIQIASFHPNYQFAGTNKEDVTNYTNRSPFPLIHLLREDSVTEAVTHYEDIEEIPERNMELMRQLRKDGKI